jgi:type IV pilus assembly protein PilN
MIRINLLPVRAAQKKARLQGQLVVLVLSLVLVSLICGGLYTTVAMKISAEKKEIAEIDKEINRLKKTLGEVAQFKKLQKEFQGKLDVLAKLKEKKTGPVHLLDELSRVLPDKLWLSSVKESGGRVSIQGVGLNEETVARFMRDLEASPYYQQVELRVTEQTKQGSLKLQKFQISCRVETPAAPKAK